MVAGESFAECSSPSCPASVRDDCSKWRSEVQAQTPTVVVDAKTPDGHDASDVTVSVDGVVVAKKLDGRAVAVDPGAHRISFMRAGSSPITEDVIFKEGVKNRVFTVRFASESGGGGAPALAEGGTSGHTIYPFIVGGVGAVAIIVGVVVILQSPALPTNCDGATQVCQVPRTPGIDSAQYRANQLPADADKAGQHDVQPKIGAAIAVSGGLVLAGSIVWYLLEPTAKQKQSGHVAPWLDRTSGGLSFRGAF